MVDAAAMERSQWVEMQLGMQLGADVEPRAAVLVVSVPLVGFLPASASASQYQWPRRLVMSCWRAAVDIARRDAAMFRAQCALLSASRTEMMWPARSLRSWTCAAAQACLYESLRPSVGGGPEQ